MPGFDCPPLVVRDLNKRYKGGVWANRNVNIAVAPGEVMGIVGPNGAGKTTLVRQITTELLPTSGEVRVFGLDAVAEPLAVKALLGVMPQEATLFGYLTVRQHLRVFGKLRGLSPRVADRRAEELLTSLDLAAHRNEPVDRLSGGLKRRVFIGIAALAQPPLMVLDEPTTGLDPRSRRDLWGQIKRYRDQGTSVLITTHYMEEAEELCDRVGIMQGGRLLGLDTVANLRAQHGCQFKITFRPDGPAEEPVTLYGADFGELVARVRDKGVQEHAVSETNLEDVYLALTGRSGDLDDRPS